MSAGRTSWWPRDAAEHDRELTVELGEEFGPAGPYTVTVLKDLAQQQRDEHGTVRTGFRSLRVKTHIADVEEQRAIVEHAARIGALDDLVVDDDGRRFTCRVSGWRADCARGRAAIKKAAQRNDEELVPSEGDVSLSATDFRDMSPRADSTVAGAPADVPAAGRADDPVGANCPPGGGQGRELSLPEGTTTAVVPQNGPLVPPTRTNQNIEQPSVEHPLYADPVVVGLSRLLASLVCRNDPKAASRVKPDGKRWLTAMRLLVADRGGDIAEVERVLRWSQDDAFWQGNILSPTKLREQFTQLAIKARNGNTRSSGDPVRAARRERSSAALSSLMGETAA